VQENRGGAVAEVTPRRPANITKGRAFRSQRFLKPGT